MYTAVKHIHLFMIACSVLLFIVRYALMMVDSALRNKAFFKRVPHVVDTAMLLSGVALIFITGFIPFTGAAPWLTEKLTCVLVYIALGFVTLGNSKNKVFKTFAFLGALGWLMVAANIAMTKATFLG
ncbi:SirB2 family protein [Aliivibrio sp. SR45-2]|uniref:SirB2 family protein n=1 Tax=Aliivibrio sp. SR45-2 TaxID=2760931 RepID=UPI0015FC7920|nr:SirB2 family protein [Aliivibrio sp. SR45-2]MBB1314612.1 SirB2 family protein [Aliivibrio sp. SR45-2]